MAKIREILRQTKVEFAKRQRRCHRNRAHAVAKGESCLVIRDPDSGSSKNYCRECAGAILARAAEDLRRFHEELGLNSESLVVLTRGQVLSDVEGS